MTARRVLLLALNAVLAALFSVLWQTDPRRADGPTVTVPVAGHPDRVVAVGLPTEPVSARPLFRLPKPVAAVLPDETPPATDPRPSFRLVGVVWGEADRIAVVQVSEEGSTRRTRVGEAIEGWRLTEVTPRAATFQSDTRTIVLDLLRHRPSAAAEPSGRASMQPALPRAFFVGDAARLFLHGKQGVSEDSSRIPCLERT